MSVADKVGGTPTRDTAKTEDDEKPTDLHFTPDEEAKLLAQSNEIKISANKLFADSSYSDAVTSYHRALAECPRYLDYEVAVLQANIAACHVKLREWKEAIDSATSSLDGLEKLDPVPRVEAKNGNETKSDTKEVNDVQEVDDDTEARLASLSRTGRSIDDVRRLRVKALLRRAKAKEELGTWATLQGASEDYQQLSHMQLTQLDAQTVRRALQALNPRLEEAKSREMADMMGKLKQLGNGILKPFGLSTDNFNMVKDEKTGGYSMNFNQGK